VVLEEKKQHADGRIWVKFEDSAFTAQLLTYSLGFGSNFLAKTAPRRLL